ncbi:type I-E CRISPR-associated protein Cse1/CasA [Lysobacteraceae bacterium NML120232]|nr:type I-E CRISPR-associated protein Cse1/CasA [Xanthomonadaceae bacterium NML120232]
MEKSFNLLDEPWLPVRLADGSIKNVSLLEAFRRSGEIVALAETAPPNLVAQYRLLLAILHRALTRRHPQGWKDKDRARWWREGLPIEAIVAYLEYWRERFWLFHPEYPFMQVAALGEAEETRGKLKPWTQISLASASGNTPVLFDHAWDDAPSAITPAAAISALLGLMQFTPGGLVKVFRDSDKAGALANTAAVLPVGENLAQTLLLCLHPWQEHDDLPSWERAVLTTLELCANPVMASGSNDRYTRQSRAVLLRSESDGLVRWLHFSAGFALEKGNAPDPMNCLLGKVDENSGEIKWRTLGFSDNRSFWRDLSALAPNPAGTSQPAAVLSYAAALHDEINPFNSVFQPVLVAGIANSPKKAAKLERWRTERIVLPLMLLKDADKALYLRKLVQKAETLFGEAKALAVRMLAEIMPAPGDNKDPYKNANAQLDVSSFSASYFAQAERYLPEVLQQLGLGEFAQATQSWNQALRDSAMAAWRQLVHSMGGGVLAWRADAKYAGAFHAVLNKHAPKPETDSAHKEETA